MITENVNIRIMKIGIIVFEISFMFWDENIIRRVLIRVRSIKIIENLSSLNVSSIIIVYFILIRQSKIIIINDK